MGLPRRLPYLRADCERGPRPCPHASCRYHLWADLRPGTGSLRLAHPGIEPWELDETCALDVAARGEHTLEQVGEYVGLTRERTRQIEEVALAKLRRMVDRLGVVLTDEAAVH